jgi:hypothetical protein
VLAIIWLMVEKPGRGGGIAACMIGYGAGLLLAAALANKTAAEAGAAVTEPAA